MFVKIFTRCANLKLCQPGILPGPARNACTSTLTFFLCCQNKTKKKLMSKMMMMMFSDKDQSKWSSESDQWRRKKWKHPQLFFSQTHNSCFCSDLTELEFTKNTKWNRKYLLSFLYCFKLIVQKSQHKTGETINCQTIGSLSLHVFSRICSFGEHV